MGSNPDEVELGGGGGGEGGGGVYIVLLSNLYLNQLYRNLPAMLSATSPLL